MLNRQSLATLAAVGALAFPARVSGQETRIGPETSAYRVQILASDVASEASDEARRVYALLEGRFPVYVLHSDPWFTVRVGDFPSLDHAQGVLGRVRSLGYEDAWLAASREAKTLVALTAGDPRRVEIEEAASDSVRGSVAAPGAPGTNSSGEEPAFRTETATATNGSVDSGRPDEVRRAVEVREFPALEKSTLSASGASLRGEAGASARPGTSESAAGDEERLRIFSTRATPVIDGRIDEAAWARARWTSEFQQRGKDRGFPPWDSTRVAFLHDEEALYVAGRMWVGNREHLRALIGGRDDPGNVERLLVSLDTYQDRQTAYTFGVTAGGARVDYQHARDNEGWKDDSFDPVWEARAVVDSLGWTAEMRIPFSQLRYNERERPVWGLNIRRWNPSTFLNVYWSVVPYEQTGWSSRFGALEGLPTLPATRRLEIVPYALWGAALPDGRLRGEGVENDFETRVGGDVKLGLAPNLTLDATLNPDFGQVEADPAQVNLTQFETFFPEKRPFFLEGRHLFQSRGPNYFYSRRIGSVPPGTSPSNVLETPVAAEILGAGKVTGRLESGLSIGAITALTQPERVAVDALPGDPVGAGAERAVTVAPRTAFVVARLHQEVGPAGSGVGVLFTGVDRFMTPGEGLASALTANAFSGGVDGAVRFGEGLYEVSGYAGFSHVRGEPTAILRQQTASTRYYQRPDATHVGIDSSATSLTGSAAGLSVARIGGAHWLWKGSVSLRSPGFEIRDAGSQARADRIDASAGFSYGTRGIGKGSIHTYRIGASLSAGWNYGGVRRYTTPGLYADVTWRNLVRSVVQFELATRAQSDDLTRGGPLMATPLRAGVRVNLTGSPVPLSQWYVNASGFLDELGGWSGSMDGGVSFQPSARFGISVGPGFSRSRDARQYFDALESGPPETFGTRYVFGALDRTEWYAHLRLSYAVTPDLALELYAEPFTSSGRFSDFGELARPGSRQLRMYGEDGTTIETSDDGTRLVTDGTETFTFWNADFRVRSFRSNAVLRWEWSRGSALHLIWQQNRWSFDDLGASPRSLFGALGDPGENLLVAKISYWISP